MKIMTRTSVWVAALTIASGSALARQDGKGKPEPEFTKGTVLVFDFAGLQAMMTDPKDQAMAKALSLVPSRVRELPREVPDMPPEAARYINLTLATVSKPTRLSVTYNGENPSGGFFGYGVTLSFLTGEQAGADDLHAAINPLVAQSGMRVKSGQGTRFAGMSDIQTPIGLASFGPRQTKEGWRYEAAIGTVENQDAVFAELPAVPAGITPLVRARLDMAGLAALQKMGQGMGRQDPQVAERLKKLEELGIMGGAAGKTSYVAGTTKDESVSITIQEAAKAHHTQVAPLGADDFAAIPSDASDAIISHGEMSPSVLIDVLQGLGGEEASHILDEFRNQTGVDLKTDLFDSLGSNFAFYTSETTGGGGLASIVAMISLKDRAKFVAAAGKLASFGNAMADKLPIGPGYIKIATWKDGENDLMTIRFPGLPVPLELSMGVTGKWLIVSPTPQGILAATRQASGKGDGGLMANALFKSKFPADRKAISVSFSDTASHLREGYGLLTMVGSAVSNMVRSPVDPAREPGLTVPLFNELKKGVQPRISYSYWRGEDLVSETHSDKSMLVASCGMMGTIGTVVPLIAVPAALFAVQERGRLGWGDEAPVGAALARLALRTMPARDPALILLTLLPDDALESVPQWFIPAHN